MSPPDYTRWNRAGLRAFRYVGGNAALFLEELRSLLQARFDGRWGDLPPGVDLPGQDEGDDPAGRQHLRNQRLVEQYQGDATRRELGWELTRALSRSCHVLAAHVDAHANEAFLRTATQWESVRRIVELIDYHPAPATSAITDIVIDAKPGQAGLLPKGFQIKHTPPSGDPQVVFETLDDIEIDHQLNQLRPAGWDSSDAPSAGAPAAPSAPAGPRLGPIAREAVTVIEGIDAARAAILDGMMASRRCTVADLLDMDPRDPRLTHGTPARAHPGIAEAWLREFKVKAHTAAAFELEPGWDAIAGWTLAEVAAASAQALADLTGKTADAVTALQRRIELLGACLDGGFYGRTRLGALGPPPSPAAPTGVETSWLAPAKPKVAAGQVALVMHTEALRAQAARVASVDAATGRIHLSPSPLDQGWWEWPKRVARLLVVPRWKRKAWLNGANVVRTRAPHGITKGAFVAWRRGAEWAFAEVIEADQRNLRLRTGSPLPGDGTPLVEARPLEGPRLAPGMEFGLVGAPVPPKGIADVPVSTETRSADFLAVPDPPSLPAGMLPPASLSFGSFLMPSPFLPMDLVKAAVEMLLSMGVMVIPSTGEPVFKKPTLPVADQVTALLALLTPEYWKPPEPSAAGKAALLTHVLTPTGDPPETVVFKELTDKIAQALAAHGPLLGVSRDPVVKAIVTANVPRYVCDGAPDGIEVGDFIAGDFVEGLRGLRIEEITRLGGGDAPECFGVAFEGFAGSAGELHLLHADFRARLEPAGGRVNQAPVAPDRIELDPVPAGLKPGRKVLVTAPGKPPLAARVVELVPGGVRLEPPPTGTKGEIVIRGNVVSAGHGAARPQKQLSSGLTSVNKALALEAAGVSTVPDPLFPTGVRAAVEVRVGDMVWKQVARLDGCGPADPCYTVRATEAGSLALVFGDGVHGRRLPTGTNNVRVGFRAGAGRAGNLPAGSLTKPVHPHRLVQALEQPKASVGGEEVERVEDIRERAPGTLLALERSVSIADFENLAASRNDVWQARAFFFPGGAGRWDLVRVVVVPAGGGDVDGPLKSELEAFLGAHAVPTVMIRVDGFSRHEVTLDVTVRVDQARFDPNDVAERVRGALAGGFELERRTIATPLHLSEVYRVVEDVEGVSDSVCAFRGTNAGAREIRPAGQDEVVYLGADRADVTVAAVGYAP